MVATWSVVVSRGCCDSDFVSDPYRALRYALRCISAARPLGVEVDAVAAGTRTDANPAWFARRTGAEPLVPWLPASRYRDAGSIDGSFVAR